MKKIILSLGVALGITLCIPLQASATDAEFTTNIKGYDDVPPITYVGEVCWVGAPYDMQRVGFGYYTSEENKQTAIQEAKDDCMRQLFGSDVIVTQGDFLTDVTLNSGTSDRAGKAPPGQSLNKDVPARTVIFKGNPTTFYFTGEEFFPNTKYSNWICGISGPGRSVSYDAREEDYHTRNMIGVYRSIEAKNMLSTGPIEKDVKKSLLSNFQEKALRWGGEQLKNDVTINTINCISIAPKINEVINRQLSKPKLTLSPSKGFTKDNGRFYEGTITGIETTGSKVKYSCVTVGVLPQADGSKKVDTSLANGCVISAGSNGALNIKVDPSLRLKSIAVVAQREPDDVTENNNSSTSLIKKYSDIVYLEDMCKVGYTFSTNTQKCEPLKAPQINLTSDDTGSGKYKYGVIDFEKSISTTFSCIVKSEVDGGSESFNSDDCVISSNGLVHGKVPFTIKPGLNGKYIEIKATASDGSVFYSNPVFLKDTTANNCTYTNSVHSKNGTICYPYPPCTLVSSDITASFEANKGTYGDGMVKMLFKNEISLNRSLEVLNYDNEKAGISISDTDGNVIEVTDNIINKSLNVSHYSYMAKLFCENGVSSDICKINVFTDGTATICVGR